MVFILVAWGQLAKWVAQKLNYNTTKYNTTKYTQLKHTFGNSQAINVFYLVDCFQVCYI